MKYLIICLLLTGVFLNTSTAQHIDSIYPEMNPRGWIPWKSIRSLHPLNDTSFVVLCNSGRVYAMHINGSRLWDSHIIHIHRSNYMTGGWIAGNNPQRLLISYIDDACDTWGGSNHTILNLETGGLNQIPAPFSSDEFAFPDLPGLPRYIFYNDSTYSLYFNADSIVVKNTFSKIRLIDINSRGDLVFMTQDSLSLYRYKSGEFRLSVKAKHFISEHPHRIHFATDTNFMIHLENDIRLFDSKLIYVKRYEVDDHNFQPYQTTRNWDDPFLVIVDRPDDSINLLVLDQHLNPVFKSPYPFTDRNITDLIYLGDSTFVFTGSMYDNDNSVTYLKSYDFKQEAVNSRTDISLSEVRFDELNFVGPANCIMGQLLEYNIKNVAIDVTNHGNTVIDEVIIASEFPLCAFYCWPETIYHDTLTNIHLLPGETQTFYLGTDIVLDQEYDQEDGVCLYALLPDNHFDADGSNDYYCFNQPVSTAEIPVRNWFYPSPTSGTITVLLSAVIQIGVYDMSGKRIIVEPGTSDQRSIDVSGLAPGNYCLVALTSNGNTVSDIFVKL